MEDIKDKVIDILIDKLIKEFSTKKDCKGCPMINWGGDCMWFCVNANSWKDWAFAQAQNQLLTTKDKSIDANALSVNLTYEGIPHGIVDVIRENTCSAILTTDTDELGWHIVNRG